jgi:ribose transport system permease protein
MTATGVLGDVGGRSMPWRSGVWREALRDHEWGVGITVVFVVMVAYWSAIAPHWGSFDVQSLVLAAVPFAFAAVAQAVVVISGGIDLGIGSFMSVVNVASAVLMVHETTTEALVVAVGMLFGGVLQGAAVGWFITRTGIPDIVVTLGTFYMWEGAALVILPTPGGGAPAGFQSLGTGTLGSQWVPSGLVVLAVALGVVWLPLRRRRFGLSLLAVGSNRSAAFLSGVNVERARVSAYMLGGLFAALGGLALTATTGTGDASSGQLYTLNSVAAVVIGGVSLAGGQGGVLGPVCGAFIVSLFTTILLLLGVDPNYGQVAQGALVVAVVMAGGLLLRKPKR